MNNNSNRNTKGVNNKFKIIIIIKGKIKTNNYKIKTNNYKIKTINCKIKTNNYKIKTKNIRIRI